MTLVPFRRKPSLNRSGRSKPPLTISAPKNLGDKLQVLASRSPESLIAVELLVDTILERLAYEEIARFILIVAIGLSC